MLRGWALMLLAGAMAGRGLGQTPPTPAEISQLVKEAAVYEPGQSLEPFRLIEDWVRQAATRSSWQARVEPALIQLLGPGATFEAQRFACKQLAIVGGDRSLPALAGLLRQEQTAGIACLALTAYPPGKADETLRQALSGATGTTRVQLIDTLGDRRDAKSAKLLAGLARGADAEAAAAAIAALGKLADAAALAGLRRGLDPALEPALTAARLRCAQELAAAGKRKAAVGLYEQLLAGSQPAYVRRAAFSALLQADPGRAEQRILKVLRGTDESLRPAAIAGVRSLAGKGVSAKFAAELSTLSAPEQVWLIDSLAARGDAPARTALGRAVGASEPGVSLAAIRALGRIGDASAVRVLARGLGGSLEERQATESALVSLGGGDKTDVAVRVELKQATGTARASLVAVVALREGAEANRLLFEEADAPDAAVAKAAFRALGKTAGGSDLPILLEKVGAVSDPEVRGVAESAAAQALARVESVAQRSSLVRNGLGRAKSFEGRAAMLALLPSCGDSDALAVAQAAAKDLDARVRAPAVRALADWPDDGAWETLAQIYRRPESETFRAIALGGLVRLAGEANAHPTAGLVERYRLLLAGAQGDGDGKLILGAMGGAADPGVLELAVLSLDKPGVKAEAEAAVRRIAAAVKATHPQAAEAALARLGAKP
jgi:hypothetical protein